MISVIFTTVCCWAVTAAATIMFAALFLEDQHLVVAVVLKDLGLDHSTINANGNVFTIGNHQDTIEIDRITGFTCQAFPPKGHRSGRTRYCFAAGMNDCEHRNATLCSGPPGRGSDKRFPRGPPDYRHQRSLVNTTPQPFVAEFPPMCELLWF